MATNSAERPYNITNWTNELSCECKQVNVWTNEPTNEWTIEWMEKKLYKHTHTQVYRRLRYMHVPTNNNTTFIVIKQSFFFNFSLPLNDVNRFIFVTKISQHKKRHRCIYIVYMYIPANTQQQQQQNVKL